MYLKFIKIEFSRAFKDLKLWIAVLVGCIISVIQFVNLTLPYLGHVNSNLFYPVSVVETYIMKADTIYTVFMWYALPLLAGYAIGSSYLSDKKSGYLKSLFIKADKKVYYVSKYIINIIASFFVVSVPLLLNLFLTMQVVPNLKPKGNGGFFIYWSHAMMGIYVNKPVVYLLIYIFIAAVIVASFTSLTLIMGDFINNIYIIMFIPFICYIMLHFISMYFDARWSPLYMMDGDQMVNFDWSRFVILNSAILGASFIYFIIYGKRKDVI